MKQTNRSKVKRAPKRGIYDTETIYEILDASQICHIAFNHQGHPVSIPTIFGRSGDKLYIHGATVSRMLQELEKGVEISLSVAHVDGLILARSAFHHSMNYRSVVVFGMATPVPSAQKNEALKVISDHLIPGRWEEVRLPNAKELKATTILEISIEEASAKVRTGGPVDDREDYDLDIWAGELPFKTIAQHPVNDSRLKQGLEVPQSVLDFLQMKR
jgi:hypothetical protein